MTDFGNDTRVVYSIQAVCHPYNVNYNHWSLNIQFKDNATSTTVAGSLRCHMTVDGETGDTVYAVIANSYAISNNCVLTVDFVPTSSQIPVGYISQVIRNNKLHKFEYSSEGSGCRHWIYLAIQHLEAARYVADGSTARLWPYLHSFWDTVADNAGGMQARSRPSTLIYGLPQ
ncbi:hypothetical protein K505DRAFT_75768 [Melanomma pulvis-pyrius CBS 109.77]|uniref:DUF7770 domain-containing protein n=1 Tax=Melanomma pulvis-pyrius CBS 109.77 TaxID=1314802 RepID=A0A6A6X3H4_9PLEO|nr:hypothetical protein K505DRAFT_75768 [Melanomma pulvis-pyrius CBS 109.77]